MTGDAGSAFAVIELRAPNARPHAPRALDTGRWSHAHAIVQPLEDYLGSARPIRGSAGWIDRGRLATEDPDGKPPTPALRAGRLWLFLVGSHANREVDAAATSTRRSAPTCDILTRLQAQPPSRSAQGDLASRLPPARHGRPGARATSTTPRPGTRIPGDQGGARRPARHGAAATTSSAWSPRSAGDLDDAEAWYRKSLTIKEQLGNRPGMAEQLPPARHRRPGPRAPRRRRGLVPPSPSRSTRSSATGPAWPISYHQLGMVAQHRGRLDDAEDWYPKSLAINEAARRPARHGQQLPPARHGRPGSRAPRRRPRPGTASPSRSTRSSATGPAWRAATTSSASSPRTAGASTRPRTGTRSPWRSRSSSATGPAWPAATTSSACVAQDRGRPRRGRGTGTPDP